MTLGDVSVQVRFIAPRGGFLMRSVHLTSIQPLPTRAHGIACSYSEADDGLSRSWHGRVFLNPPFDRYVVGKSQWVETRGSQ